MNEDIKTQAASEIIDALLELCESQEERTRLAIAILGFDPR